MAEEFEEEYYDDEEGEDYNEEEHDADYDYNEDGGEDGDIQVGEEIDLTHEEVWDDSALIEAWDMAVKQYEVYHSKANPTVNPKDNPKDKIAKSLTSSSSVKHKHTDSAPQSSTSSTKRTKLTHINGTSTTPQLTGLEPDSSPTSTPVQAQPPPSQGTNSQYDVSERKPSFKKADKPSFSHHKERREEFEKEKARKANAPTSTARTTATSSPKSAVPVPMIDAATIAYYRQLGYYYDPSYAVADGLEAALQGEEHRQEGDEGGDQSQSQEQQDQLRHQQEHGHDESENIVEAAGNSKVSGSAHTSHGSGTSSSKTKPTSTSATSRAGYKNRSAYPIPNPCVPGAAMHPSQSPLYPSLHGFYPGYHPGHLPPAPPSHIPPGVPTAAVGPGGGGFGFPVPSGMPGMPGMAPLGWNGPGGSTSFGHGASAAAGRGMIPPPPFPPHSAGGGAFSGPKMDDEALGNLIMAWYFSGYYTGLYQAQRR